MTESSPEKAAERRSGQAPEPLRWVRDFLRRHLPRGIVQLVIALCAVALLSWLAFLRFPGAAISEPDYLTTLLQIVPSTVVAVFVFAAATVFVIAQVIHSPLGSRGVEVLLSSNRSHFVLGTGVLLLIASLLFAVSAPDVPRGGELPPAATALATGLAAATALYAGFAVILIFALLRDFVQPERYAERLCGSRERRYLRSEDAYQRIRTIRQWLRTACGSGESRDITLCLVALRNLVDWYVDSVTDERRSPERRTRLRERPPGEYETTGTVVRTHWKTIWDAPGAAAREGTGVDGTPARKDTPAEPESGHTERTSSHQPPEGDATAEERQEEKRLPGWFGGEIGRAAARSLETGIRGRTLLVRDADRILGTMCWATIRFHEAELTEEAAYLVDRIAEIGLFHQLADEKLYQTWCTQSSAFSLVKLADRLRDEPARLQLPPEHGETAAEVPRTPPHSLRDRVLVGWLLIKYDQAMCRQVPRGQTEAGRSAMTPDEAGTTSDGRRRLRRLRRVWIRVTGAGAPADRPDEVVAPAPDDGEPDLCESDLRATLGRSPDTAVVTQLARRLIDDLSWLETLQLERTRVLHGQDPVDVRSLESFLGAMIERLSPSEIGDGHGGRGQRLIRHPDG
ncbi:hypothetical protein [Blastococcus deserti]|uniref:DUF2254 domain-containing protein n=1 Tax=Blastococcus deserti TaxID=2259033 RepID=A0ABW4XJL3_9ACTN